MDQSIILKKTHLFVKETLKDAESGHDYFHILRVLKNAEIIAKQEGGDIFVIQLGALLHDIADAKFYNGNEEIGPQKADAFLKKQQVPLSIRMQVLDIIRYISFKNSFEKVPEKSLELKIVQDADRLDAIGAIGIARTFIFSGYKGNPMYDPEILSQNYKKLDKETYKKNNTAAINHFYEKLLKIKDLMNTTTGKNMAEKRHKFMLDFLDQFYQEWDI